MRITGKNIVLILLMLGWTGVWANGTRESIPVGLAIAFGAFWVVGILTLWGARDK